MPADRRGSRRQFLASASSALALSMLFNRREARAVILDPKGDTMMTLTPYLLFDGTCLQAMQFYQSVFGGELKAIKVKDSPARNSMPPFQQEKTINAHLQNGALQISASDWLRPDRTPIRGNTVCLYLSGGAFQQLRATFEKLSEGAEVTDPLKEMFFGWYGALNDRFGVRWMFQANRQDG